MRETPAHDARVGARRNQADGSCRASAQRDRVVTEPGAQLEHGSVLVDQLQGPQAQLVQPGDLVIMLALGGAAIWALAAWRGR